MKLSLITDEVSQNPTQAALFAVDHGLQYVAVRSAWGRNVLELTDREVSDLSAIFGIHGLKVSAVMSPLFKCWPPGVEIASDDVVDPHFIGFSPKLVDHLNHGRRLPAIADVLGAPVVRVFTFLADKADTHLAPEALDVIVRMLQEWPPGLAAVENECTCHVRTLDELEGMCRGFSVVAAAVDPCNQHLAAATVGLKQLTTGLVDRTVDVHVKDRTDSGYVPVGQGKLEWPLIFHRLSELNYEGFITLESHLCDDIDGVAMSLEAVRKWIA